jgi:hypothetical protein
VHLNSLGCDFLGGSDGQCGCFLWTLFGVRYGIARVCESWLVVGLRTEGAMVFLE